MKELESVDNFEQTLARLRVFKGPYSYAAAVGGNSSNFKMALFADSGFSGLWELEDGPWILGLGDFEPAFIPALIAQASSIQVRVTIPRSWSEVELAKRSEWNFFQIEATDLLYQPLKHKVEELTSSDQINAFIDQYAPDSSTRPGDSELLFWHGIRDDQGELLSIGGAVRWKSGSTMLVSIATAPSARGKSMAQEVTSSLVKRLFDLGSPRVGLGVWGHNTAAIRAYVRVGFQLQEEFASGPLRLA